MASIHLILTIIFILFLTKGRVRVLSSRNLDSILVTPVYAVALEEAT